VEGSFASDETAADPCAVVTANCFCFLIRIDNRYSLFCNHTPLHQIRIDGNTILEEDAREVNGYNQRG
jgi:hypothetical protein